MRLKAGMAGTANSVETLASIVRRKHKNSLNRWRRCSSPITWRVAMSSAANSVVVPCRATLSLNSGSVETLKVSRPSRSCVCISDAEASGSGQNG